MKRTKKQKVKASLRRVNSQLTYKFEESYNLKPKNESAQTTARYQNLGSIKKELLRSLIVASLILISLMVIYWVS